jgi:N-acetylglucosaminyldiphosphoundecaprenol N-acetyl-beta-D-mannosaminyltransferase
MRVDAVSCRDAVTQVLDWALRRESRSVCFATVHMVMEAFDSPGYRAMINAADLVAPDGMPLVWALRTLGVGAAARVYGPDLTATLLAEAERRNIPVGFYGGSPAVLARLVERVRRCFPAIDIVFEHSPPFRELSLDERALEVAALRESGVGLLFVGLGCPKQERWMAEHSRHLPAVLLGVGAAFDFLSGVKPQAPRWMMAAGLEWLFRLLTEPRRLWLRYLKQNPRFLTHFTLQLLRARRRSAA